MANVPDAAIDAKWQRAKKLGAALELKVNALGARAKNILDARMIAGSKGIVIPGLDDWLMDVQTQQAKQVRIARALADVMTGRLGLRKSRQVSGDIDIMAPPGTNEDDLAQYSFGWVLIAVGVVVAVGIIAALWHEHSEADKSRNYYRPLFQECDARLAGDAEWEEKKASREFALRKTTWDRMEGAAKKLMGGVQVGLAIAIPLAALVLMSWLKPAKR